MDNFFILLTIILLLIGLADFLKFNKKNKKRKAADLAAEAKIKEKKILIPTEQVKLFMSKEIIGKYNDENVPAFVVPDDVNMEPNIYEFAGVFCKSAPYQKTGLIYNNLFYEKTDKIIKVVKNVKKDLD